MQYIWHGYCTFLDTFKRQIVFNLLKHSSSNTSSGWSCGSDDDGTNSFNHKFNIKSTEQRSGSKAAFLQKMVEVLESYFNDDGLKRNQFLMKQLQTNPDGIPLKKIASMRRVKVESLAIIRRAGKIKSFAFPAPQRSPIFVLN